MILDRLRTLFGGWPPARRLHLRRRVLRGEFLRRIGLPFESLEDRRVLATVTWDGGAGTFAWGDVLNWDGDTLPGVADDVVIGDLSGTPTINSTGTVSINRVTSSETIGIS